MNFKYSITLIFFCSKQIYKLKKLMKFSKCSKFNNILGPRFWLHKNKRTLFYILVFNRLFFEFLQIYIYQYVIVAKSYNRQQRSVDGLDHSSVSLLGIHAIKIYSRTNNKHPLSFTSLLSTNRTAISYCFTSHRLYSSLIV